MEVSQHALFPGPSVSSSSIFLIYTPLHSCRLFFYTLIVCAPNPFPLEWNYFSFLFISGSSATTSVQKYIWVE